MIVVTSSKVDAEVTSFGNDVVSAAAVGIGEGWTEAVHLGHTGIVKVSVTVEMV